MLTWWCRLRRGGYGMIRLVIRKMRGILGRLRRRCGKRRKRVAESTRWFWRIEGPISPMRKQRLQRRDQY